MIVLGLDPSLCWYGWAIVSRTAEHDLVLAAGCIRTEKDARKSHMYAADQDAQRVGAIAAELLRVLRDNSGPLRMGFDATAPGWQVERGEIHRVVCEAPAGSQHAVSAKALGQSLGVTIGVMASHGRGLRFVQAHEVKQVVGGSKDASKDAVALGVHRRTGWQSAGKTKPAREAEHDAAAVALTLTLEELSA